MHICTKVIILVFLLVSVVCLENDKEILEKKEETVPEDVVELLKKEINAEKEHVKEQEKVNNYRIREEPNKAEIFEISDIFAIEKSRQRNARANIENERDKIVFPTENENSKTSKDTEIKVIYPPLKSLIKTVKIVEVPRKNKKPQKSDNDFEEENNRGSLSRGNISSKKKADITEENIKILEKLLEEIQKERVLLEKAKAERVIEESKKVREEIEAKKSTPIKPAPEEKSVPKIPEPIKETTLLENSKIIAKPAINEEIEKQKSSQNPEPSDLGLLNGPKHFQGFGLHHSPPAFSPYPYHLPHTFFLKENSEGVGFRQGKSTDKNDIELNNESKLNDI